MQNDAFDVPYGEDYPGESALRLGPVFVPAASRLHGIVL